MPLPLINITSEDIEYAEKTLFGGIGKFSIKEEDSADIIKSKEERINFIKNLETIDLQAVPGSGKTTALLAKLLILEKNMPFDNGQGILVISHTNAAIDEIKKKIEYHCPQLFTYPNFVGTVQSFINKFLAIPYYTNCYKSKPDGIDDAIYIEKAIKAYNFIDKSTKKWMESAYGDKAMQAFVNFRFDQDMNIVSGLGGKIKLRAKNKSKSYKHIIAAKIKLMKWGYLSFDDAYFLAEKYITNYSQIKKILQNRFKYVFVDEMQDMEKHQYDILENIFIDEGSSNSIFQRIGDKNQSIYSNGNSIGGDSIWKDRIDNQGNKKVLYLTGSHRLTNEVASVLNFFALENSEQFKTIALNKLQSPIKPHIIVFSDPEEVLNQFIKLIDKYELPRIPDKPYFAIGWIADFKYDDDNQPDKSKYTIKCYFEEFQRIVNNRLENTSESIDNQLGLYKNKSLNTVYENILNIFTKVMRIENIKLEAENKIIISDSVEYKRFTKHRLLRYLRENVSDVYEDFRFKLFKWSWGISNGNLENNLNEIKEFIPLFLKEIFACESLSEYANKFISEKTSLINIVDEDQMPKNINRIYDESKDITVEIGTVHSIKGQTHTATLYMESYYYNDGGNSYESERLSDQFKQEMLKSDSKDRVKQSAKMIYVGFSRPTHLLCFAVHRDRWDKMKCDVIENNWEIIEEDVT